MAKYKIIPSSRTIVQSPISIGHKAEKGVEAIEFDLTAWVETYGSGTLTVIMRRWGDAIPYPIALEIDENNKATWVLSDTDTAKAGMAYAQLNYIVGDEVVKKSDIYTFRVMDSLTGEGDPPEAYESWLEHLTHLAAEAMAEVLDIEGIVTDKTLTVEGGIADAKAAGDALALKADKSTTYTKTEVDQMIEDVEVETDTTLSVSGAPADAAETGRQIGLLKADLDNLDTGITPAQQALLISILRKAIYDGDQKELIDALEDSFGGIVHVTGIAFTQASISITDVETVTASYTITPANGTDPILWESSNQSIVTVSNGVITPVGDGSATITAYTSNGISATLSVTVDLPATYSVTNNLTHATNSNSSALIVEGNSYTGVITADEGYMVTSVTVTMGGTDVTSAVYANGTISIASVTGDIVITVGTAIAPPTPVYRGENLVFDGTANTVIDTGIKLCDTDKDFTIVLKVDTPTGDTVTSGNGSQLICCSAGSNGYDGYFIVRANSTNLAPRAYINSGKIDFSDAYNALSDRTQTIIMRHESGSGKITASAYVYKNSAVSVGTLTQNFTFSAHDNTTIIGARRWNGINGYITGTLKLVEIYDKYLTDEQISGYYE